MENWWVRNVTTIARDKSTPRDENIFENFIYRVDLWKFNNFKFFFEEFKKNPKAFFPCWTESQFLSLTFGVGQERKSDCAMLQLTAAVAVEILIVKWTRMKCSWTPIRLLGILHQLMTQNLKTMDGDLHAEMS